MTLEEKQQKIVEYYRLFLKAYYDNELAKERSESYYSQQPLSASCCGRMAREAVIAVEVLEGVLDSQVDSYMNKMRVNNDI